MFEIEDNVRLEIKKSVPSAIISEITCFAFYDDNPTDNLCLDIVVCTKNCEIIEYYKRESVLSTTLKLTSRPMEIKLVRNRKSELFYLVAAQNEVIFLSRRANLQIHKIVTNFERYSFDDPTCCGQENLRIFCRDDAVPLVFDENFEIVDNAVVQETPSNNDALPIVQELKRKLIEAKYTFQCNEKAYEDLLKLRQQAVDIIAQRNSFVSEDCLFKHTSKDPQGLVIEKPWYTMCNKQIIIATKLTNKYNFSIENVHMLLDTSMPSLTYTSKLYEKVHTAPYLSEKKKHNIESYSSVYLVVAMKIKELCNSVDSINNFQGLISYKKGEKELLVQIEKIEITTSDMMGEKFDILSNLNTEDQQKSTLAILATSELTKLRLRHIKDNDDIPIPDIASLFINYIQMDQYKSMKNIVIYRKSPYHVLYGVMLVFEETTSSHIYNVTVCSRTQSQVLSLVHLMHDAIPLRIIATAQNYRLVAKTSNLEYYTEKINTTEPKMNYKEYAQSLVKQSSIILKHFDECMIQMNQNKDPIIQNRIGNEIDLKAVGDIKFDQFKTSLLDEAEKSIEILNSEQNFDDDDEVMIIDD